VLGLTYLSMWLAFGLICYVVRNAFPMSVPGQGLVGAVYRLSNDVAGNAVVLNRSADGNVRSSEPVRHVERRVIGIAHAAFERVGGRKRHANNFAAAATTSSCGTSRRC
jgi:hypothetical protein